MLRAVFEMRSLFDESDLVWSQVGDLPLALEGGRSLRIDIEDEGARLNLNALVSQAPPVDDDDANANRQPGLKVGVVFQEPRHVINHAGAQPDQ